MARDGWFSRHAAVSVCAAALVGVFSANAAALERFCDPSFEDCRTPLLGLINNERIGIDVAFWFMEDARYSYALIQRFKAGVPVRIIVDPRANATYPLNADRLKELADAGIPMRKRIGSGIMHWKMMSFQGQGTVQFGGANYSAWAFVPVTPYVNYTDEVVHFTDVAAIVNTFFTKFDDLWVNTTAYADYANMFSPPVRRHPIFPKDPSLNFVPGQDYGARAVNLYNAETIAIDAIMYRITDRRHTDALIAAAGRGVPVRLITEPKEYRDPKYLWHSWNVDRLYMAGVPVRHRYHQGLNHEKLVLLYSQATSIYGSSNWTSASATSQEEHNHFFRDQTTYGGLRKQFSRKWNNSTGNIETTSFTPLPPDAPVYVGPANGSAQSTSVTLAWKPGYWAHRADVYFGTAPDPPLIARDVSVTPKTTAYYTLPALSPGRIYYWKIVSKTMANKTRTGAVWSFGT
jgi:phosphatidylserine/phosphatidylglycerophosphate/cardiolipin synthase-like enzyme